MKQNIDKKNGLSNAQVEEQIRKGLYNKDVSVKTKSNKQIIFENIFTFFNAVHLILAVLIFSTGVFCKLPIFDIFNNMLFLCIIFFNTIIGSVQEIRSKKIIDKLSLISSPKACVIRSGKKINIPTEKVVLGDLMYLSLGNQICSDCRVIDGEIELNEALITGEADNIVKKNGDMLLSGSFVASGNCLAVVESVGLDNYAQKITNGAKYIKKSKSEIIVTLDKIVKIVSFIIIPVGILLFSKQYFISDTELSDAVFSTVAALIGMIPEGLVLLTSVVFAVSVIRLAKHQTLVQELYSLETLARVDVLCLDKTGTLTKGEMEVEKIIPFKNYSEEIIESILADLTGNLQDNNATSQAIIEYINNSKYNKSLKNINFSSKRKWSAISFENDDYYIMGAGEFILGENFVSIKEKVEKFTKQGYRVIIVAKTKFKENDIPFETEVFGMIVLSDKIRENAKETLEFFKKNNVNIKIISGDNAMAVANIAKKAGLENADKYIDLSTVKTEKELEYAVKHYKIFGRVKPEQKLEIIKILKKSHTVAMTGDGSNDVLALKEADCSIAMASGTDAAKAVSNLILMSSDFSAIPKIVKEGRRSINNLQRSASLFLAKTSYSFLLSIIFIFLSQSYPFQPIQLTLISTLAIGIPSFILALEPNNDLVKGSFISNIISKSIPTGISVFISILLFSTASNYLNLDSQTFSTLSVLGTGIISLSLLLKLCTPFNKLRFSLFFCMVFMFSLFVIFLNNMFYLVNLNLTALIVLIAVSAISLLIKSLLTRLTEKTTFVHKKLTLK